MIVYRVDIICSSAVNLFNYSHENITNCVHFSHCVTYFGESLIKIRIRWPKHKSKHFAFKCAHSYLFAIDKLRSQIHNLSSEGQIIMV